MSDARRIFAITLVAMLLPWCGYRERGLEIALDVSLPEGTAPGTLAIERIEVLACPDVPGRVADLFAPAVAHAHDTSVAMGPMALSESERSTSATLRVPPGSYCDVRVHFGSAGAPALVMPEGEAAERETVLRIVDVHGVPTRLLLAHAPQRASLHLQLGAFSTDDAPARALSRVIDGAQATLASD